MVATKIFCREKKYILSKDLKRSFGHVNTIASVKENIVRQSKRFEKEIKKRCVPTSTIENLKT